MTTTYGVQSGTTGTAASQSGAKLAADFDTFLTLLTAQLKTQDPLSPMDAEQFTSQLVQFSAVEQAIQTNSKLETLVSLMQTTQHTAALGYVGATVELDNSSIHLPFGGEAQVSYELPATAQTVKITIVDSAGATVRELAGPTGAGPQGVAWDGLDDSRTSSAAGTYGVRIEALDAAGKPLAVSLTTTGKVDALLQGSDGLVLSVGGRSYPLEAVRAILPAA